MNYYNSRYNFTVKSLDGVALFNALSGALLRLTGEDGLQLAEVLCGSKVRISEEDLDKSLLNQLLQGKFLTMNPSLEMDIIRQRYERAREETPIALTITTTMDCNLGCYYCYEERSKKQLSKVQLPAILQIASEGLQRLNKKSLHVDWYGGEPLLNPVFLEEASQALQSLCTKLGATYHASIISNGTVWPEDLEDFIKRHRIRQVQISLDGLRENHNKRRRYQSAPNLSSFDQAVGVIDALLNWTRVDIRLNLDRENLSDWPFILDMIHKNGWFHKPFPATIQPARLSAYTEQSSFMRQWELSIEEYEEIRQEIRHKIPEHVTVEESEFPDGFLMPRTSVCAALAKDSVVIGADGDLYRCGLQVGESGKKVGKLSSPSHFIPLPVLGGVKNHIGDNTWWEEFDITKLVNCSRCSFLPVCWGGCPKKHLDDDQHALEEQSKYWRINLPIQIAKRAGFQPQQYLPYTKDDQFRKGW